VAPDKHAPRRTRRPVPQTGRVRVTPRPDDPYDVVYFRRHHDDDARQTAPGREYLNALPDRVRARMMAVLTQVAAAPPHRFAGGGLWEAMHGTMTGFHEVRVDFARTHYRVFCLLDSAALGRGPLLVIVDGGTKAYRTMFSPAFYDRVRALGDEYASRNPRSVI
jgi:hypothetical protein